MITEKENKFFGLNLKTIIEPTSFPVTVEEVKNFARIDGNSEDDLIQSFIEGATEAIEKYLCRALITRTIQGTFDNWVKQEIELPYSPLISVISITFISEDGIETEFDSDNYYVVSESLPGKVILKKGKQISITTNREFDGIKIIYVCGYGDPSNVPTNIKLALLQWVTMIYESRSLSTIQGEPPPEVKKNLKDYRVIRI